VKYISLRYRFGPTELIIRAGILQKTERHIPYQRIQNIDTTRTVFHRAFGVADVIVQTASGTAPEAVLKVLSVAAADEMRSRIFKGREVEAADALTTPAVGSVAPDADRTQAATGGGIAPLAPAMPGPEPGQVVARNGIADLVVFGLISNRGMLALAAVMGVVWQLGKMPSSETIERVFVSVVGEREWGLASSVIAGIGLLLFGVAALRILSIIFAIVTLYDFTLTRRGDELRTRFGLLTQHAVTIPRHRIQLIEMERTVLHRWFHRVAIRARTAGAAQREQGGTSRDWLTPLLGELRVASLLESVQPEVDYAGVDWQPIAQRAVRRLFVRSFALLAIPAILLTVRSPLTGGAAWLVIGLFAWLYARITVYHTAYAVDDRAVWFKSGWLTRTCRVVRLSKIQAVTLVETPFDRRHKMASVCIDTANAGAGQRAIAIPYLKRDIAEAIYERLSAAAAETEFRW